MRVAFVDGPWPRYGHRTQRWAHKNPGGNINPPPIFQMYAASLARERGCDVALWDAPVLDMTFEAVAAEVCRFSPRVIVQNVSTASFDHDVRLAEMLKQSKDCLLVMVGPHATALARDIMAWVPQVDVIGLGEYDETIADLVSHLDDLTKVRGIVFRQDGEVVETEPRDLIKDLDGLPFPAWDLVDIHRYWESMFPKTRRPVATLMTSRGCNHHCSFCLYPQVLFRHKLRLRNLDRVLDEIEWLKQRFGARFFYFEDDNFTASWRRVEEFSHRLFQRNLHISWGCLSRTDRVTEERLRLMRDSGCFLIKYGVESGVQTTLDAMDKKKALEETLHAFAVTKKVGILAHATVMIGTPYETRASIRETRKFVRKLGPDSAQFSICTPLPGTRFWDECMTHGWLTYDRWEDFDGVTGGVLDYPGLSKDEIRKAVQNSYLDYYASFPHIRQRMRRMIQGPERFSQFLRNFWLLKRLAMVLRSKIGWKLLDDA